MRRAKLPKAAMDVLFATPSLDYEAEFEETIAGYPNRIGRERALRYYIADRIVLGEEAPERIQTTKRLYLAFLKRDDQAWRSPMNLKTFMHLWRDWEATLSPKTAPGDGRIKEDIVRDCVGSVAAFINVQGDPDSSAAAKQLFEKWAASFIPDSPDSRWSRWKTACRELSIDPKGQA
jgi:hypothetical protein